MPAIRAIRAIRAIALAVALSSGLLRPGVASAAAEVFRCGDWLIMPGMTASEVRTKCGKPASRSVYRSPVRARGLHGTSHVIGTTSIEYWIYDRAPGQFKVRLRFDEGRLENIERLHER